MARLHSCIRLLRLGFGIALLLLAGGCYLVSVHPIAGPDQMVIDPALMGVWASGSDTLKIQGSTADNLDFEVIEGPGPATEVVRRGKMDVLITYIEGRKYLDIRPGDILDSPIPVLEQMLLIPMHILVRYEIEGDTLKLRHLDFRKFNEKNKKGRAFGLELERVTAEGPLMITSTTERIRRFLTKYGDDDTMFENPTLYVRQ